MTRTEIETTPGTASDVVAALKSFIVSGTNIAIVKAPPGSGKTYTLVESLDSAIEKRLRILVAAQTNNQVDEICLRIAERYPVRAGERRVIRFSSSGYEVPAGTGEEFDQKVEIVESKGALPDGPCVVVSTVAKLALTDFANSFDLLYVDEAWQMAWADFLPLRHVADRYILIGDPGQIPPTVAIEVDRWEATPFPPHAPAPDLLLHNEQLDPFRTEFRLPMCRRLPHDSVALVNSFYDFEFGAVAAPGERFLRPASLESLRVDGRRAQSSQSSQSSQASRVDAALARMWAAETPWTTAMITHPTPETGLPVGTDTELAAVVVDVIRRLLELECVVSTKPSEAANPRRLLASDIGVVSTHNLMNAAINQRLLAVKKSFREIRVTTPERWQGLEKPVMIAVHPLSGVMAPSEFDLETGRLCVMASRHRAACLFVTRDHIGRTLDRHLPAATQALGGADITGRGHDVHRDFIDYHEERNLVV